MRKLLKLIIAFVLLVAVGLLAAAIYVDSLARKAVEHGATYALGVKTTLNNADIKMLSGEFEMSELAVANPQGFEADHFLALEQGGVSLTLGSLREPMVELPRLTLAGLDMNLEKKAGKSNYDVILENLKRFESAEPADPDAKRYVIRTLEIRDVVVHVDLLGGGNLTKLNVPIDEIVLKDVGSDTSRGVLLADLVGVIIKAVFAAVVDKGGQLLPDDLVGDLKGGLAKLSNLKDIAQIEDLGKIVGDVAGQIDDIAGNAGKLGDKLKDGVGDAADKLGDLFGGKKGDDK